MKNIIVREYLESLTESQELDYIFPILLEVMNFKIISKAKDTRGLPQYGKDIIAIGLDKDGIRKRFYFELKGGADRNITTHTFHKPDGIVESIREAKYRPYPDTSNPSFEKLPIKIVIVHNGTLHPSVKETFDGFIRTEFPVKDSEETGFWNFLRKKPKVSENLEFERWDIYELTELFTAHLFNEYLLVDDEATILFKRVLVLINTPGNDYSDFFHLIDSILNKAASGLGKRKKILLFETIKMVSFIVYHYSVESKNLEVAKKCVPFAILRLWQWILENHLEQNEEILGHFRMVSAILYKVMEDYFNKTLPVAIQEYGLLSEQGGKYEQIGYPVRTMEYLSNLICYYYFQKEQLPEDKELVDKQLFNLVEILNKNDASTRPFFDNHSIPISLVLDYLIDNDRIKDAVSYLRNIIFSLRIAYDIHRRLPDGNNNIENVIQLILNKKKSVYYIDSTSNLLGMVSEYLAILNMEEDYYSLKVFIEKAKINIAIFIPYNDEELRTFLPQNEQTHEISLINHELRQEGYQSEITLEKTFEEFRQKIISKISNPLPYLTSQAGFSHLLILAHAYFKTPIFPSEWRSKYQSFLKN